MFTYVKPAQVGVSAKKIQKYIQVLEKIGCDTHSILMARGDKLFFEQYWSPIDANFSHRMFSVTKSFVSIAVGFAVQDGLCALDDKITDYFPEDVPEDVLPAVKQQTIRNMLMMSTGYLQSCGKWFAEQEDRVKFYFHHNREANRAAGEFSKYPGAFFDYDSTGSFILGALVERLTGKSLNAYLREKLFDKIGVSEQVRFLKCPGGHSWGDSALLCPPMDLLKVARFVLNYGSYKGEQILSRDYLEEATSDLISNGDRSAYNTFGYGYQFWRTWNNCFLFNGAAGQLALCSPDKDMILVYNGAADGRDTIIFRFLEEILETAADEPLLDDAENQSALEAYCQTLKVRSISTNVETDMQSRISGKTYHLQKNPMGITQVRLDFDGEEGVFSYVNAQGSKKLPFKICENCQAIFPQEGYPGEIGVLYAPGNYYKCVVSAGWSEKQKFSIAVRILDDYLGGFRFYFYFIDEDHVAFRSNGGGEVFGQEYNGYTEGICTKTV